MKEKFKKIWEFIKPFVWGWTLEQMAKILQARGWEVKRPK